jgi:hypothetical protein
LGDRIVRVYRVGSFPVCRRFVKSPSPARGISAGRSLAPAYYFDKFARRLSPDFRSTMTGTEYKTARETIGTQKQVAKLLGVTDITVSRRQTSKRPVTREVELAIRYLMVRVLRFKGFKQ